MVVEEVQVVGPPPIVEWDYMYNDSEEQADAQVDHKTVGSMIVSADFFTSLQDISVAASKDKTRLILCAVLVEPGNEGLRMVATDTYRLLVREGIKSKDVVLAEGLLVPLEWIEGKGGHKGAGLPAMIKENGGKRNFDWKVRDILVKVERKTTTRTYKRKSRPDNKYQSWSVRYTPEPIEHEDLVRIEEHEDVLTIGDPVTYWVPLVSGQFVNWPKIVPQQGTHQNTLDVRASDLLDCLQFCSAVAREDANRVILQADGKEIVVTAEVSEGTSRSATASATCPGQVEGPGFKACFNQVYASDFLNIEPTGWASLHYWPDGPSWEGSDKTFPHSMTWTRDNDLYVLMPMQIM